MDVEIASQQLGGLTPRAFLRRHWQKRPLFVRAALPVSSSSLDSLITLEEIVALAARDDVESRVVERSGRRRRTTHGPFSKLIVKRRDWTVLVSGLNLHHSGADRLMRSFRFVPLARVDDLMVSYAAPGGGVGPHTDSYDVFLVQGAGRRRWRVWFDGEVHSYDTGPGDLLYLPPGLKHDGVALEPCFTYSVGFRAPAGSELGAAFLDFLHERGLPEARYRDPALRPARHPALLPGTLVHFAAEVLGRIRWSRADVLRFMGEYLTTPKPHVVFSPRTSRRLLRQSMVRLDAKTQLLYSGSRFFINGETVKVDARASAALRALADRRALAGRRLADAGLATLAGAWRAAGWAHFERD